MPKPTPKMTFMTLRAVAKRHYQVAFPRGMRQQLSHSGATPQRTTGTRLLDVIFLAGGHKQREWVSLDGW